MLWLAALMSAAPAVEQPVTSRRQAQAVVRILRPAIVRMGEGVVRGEETPRVRESRLPGADGVEQPLILIEFS